MDKQISLPSGKVASIRPGTGRDLKQAIRMVPKGKKGEREEILISYALVAVLVLLDGACLTLEDVEDMPLSDLSVLMDEVGGLGGILTAQALILLARCLHWSMESILDSTLEDLAFWYEETVEFLNAEAKAEKQAWEAAKNSG